MWFPQTPGGLLTIEAIRDKLKSISGCLDNRVFGKAALRKYRRLKNLQKGPISRIGLRKMVMKFEETGDMGVLPGRARKPDCQRSHYLCG
ncbi:hypothetical protein TNCV_1811621 [Trichonephila clavipes]|nr:hypothetical protein TNCV_1811621 [Trichonephila clavipes]